MVQAFHPGELFRYAGYPAERGEQLLMAMANLATGVRLRQTGIRDFISGEKVVQGFLAAYLSVTDYYVFRSEAELKGGHRAGAAGGHSIRTCATAI